MDKEEIRAGLAALREEIATAQRALESGSEEIGLAEVGPRIERLCGAAMALPPEEVTDLQPLMTEIRDSLQTLSQSLGSAIEQARADEAADGDAPDPDLGEAGGARDDDDGRG